MVCKYVQAILRSRRWYEVHGIDLFPRWLGLGSPRSAPSRTGNAWTERTGEETPVEAAWLSPVSGTGRPSGFLTQVYSAA